MISSKKSCLGMVFAVQVRRLHPTTLRLRRATDYERGGNKLCGYGTLMNWLAKQSQTTAGGMSDARTGLKYGDE